MSKDELNIMEKEGIYIIHVNPLVYDMDVICSAAYVFLDKAYVVIDGDPKDEILVKIKPKEAQNKNLAMEFNNELINYLEYKTNFERNKDIRAAILQRVLLTSDPGLVKDDQPEQDIDFEDDTFDDPEGIAVPWEEKYGDGLDEDEGKLTMSEKKGE